MKGLSNFFNHPILDAYLKMNLITSLMPTTLIPLGVLMAVYSSIEPAGRPSGPAGKAQKGGFTLPSAMSLTDPLVGQYMSMFNIAELSALTLVPFAFLLGREMFEKVMKGYQTGKGMNSEKNNKSKKQSGGFSNWMDIPILDTYLKLQGNMNITPATLIPLGILMTVYYIIKGDKKKAENAQMGGGLPDFINMEAIQEYMKMMGIAALQPQTLVPFALILSKDLFDTYVVENKKLLSKLRLD